MEMRINKSIEIVESNFTSKHMNLEFQNEGQTGQAEFQNESQTGQAEIKSTLPFSETISK